MFNVLYAVVEDCGDYLHFWGIWHEEEVAVYYAKKFIGVAKGSPAWSSRFKVVEVEADHNYRTGKKEDGDPFYEKGEFV